MIWHLTIWDFGIIYPRAEYEWNRLVPNLNKTETVQTVHKILEYCVANSRWEVYMYIPFWQKAMWLLFNS